jgi:hypothetical protein
MREKNNRSKIQKFNDHPTGRRAPVSHAFVLFTEVKRGARAVLMLRNACPALVLDRGTITSG